MAVPQKADRASAREREGREVSAGHPTPPLFCVSVHSKGDKALYFHTDLQVLIAEELELKGREVQRRESRGGAEASGGGAVGKKRAENQNSQEMLP